MQRTSVEQRSSRNHRNHPSRVGNVSHGITLDQHEIGDFPHFDGANRVLHGEEDRGIKSGSLQGL